MDGPQEPVVDCIEVLDVQVRDHERVTVVGRPPPGRDERCCLGVAVDDVVEAVAIGLDSAQQPAEGAVVPRRGVRHLH